MSNIPAFMINNRKGIEYAYLIELIMSKDSIEAVEDTWEADDWEMAISPYRIYKNGVIVKKDKKNEPILEPLSHKDMQKIKKCI